ncbi:phytanoyl-CoA dioxygenase family protein [Brevundimonas sp. FT23042]|uniref:phytanoyl-CoA dioxygenase family protein n=1 Tax=Brevundimonas sp. FT23042 TaxID=3393749 RepID=UPI003B58A90F
MDREAFERDGALHAGRRLDADALDALRALADARIGARPGARLAGEPLLDGLLAADGPIGQVAAALSSSAARPVRAVLFDKTPEANWSVAWHQDRTLPVHERIEVEGFGPWSTKDGRLHVAPPFEVLARMVTLRVHLDPVDADNAPLRIALGSHRLGRVPSADAAAQASRLPRHVCLAETGEVWAYSTPILHASDPSSGGRRRRVLQVDYADFDLPGGLDWRGLE